MNFYGFINKVEIGTLGEVGFDGYSDRWFYIAKGVDNVVKSGDDVLFVRNTDTFPVNANRYKYILFFETESPEYTINSKTFVEYNCKFSESLISFTWDVDKVDGIHTFYLPYSGNVSFKYEGGFRKNKGVAIFRPGTLKRPIVYFRRISYFRKLLNSYNDDVDVCGDNWKFLDKVIWKLLLLDKNINFKLGRVDRKIEKLSEYRDYLCFENIRKPYYISEKILDGLLSSCNVYYYGGNVLSFKERLGLDFDCNSFGNGGFVIFKLDKSQQESIYCSNLNNENLAKYISKSLLSIIEHKST